MLFLKPLAEYVNVNSLFSILFLQDSKAHVPQG
ncbi:hypothetical protein ACP_0418 [Acidobacterium capsulatum ATCC 51196]|uniref:Uncharacterized protein n=1 Tax=Acidobacterium capsulatum (strain ATCC 51196 / DSM 11244 / BCRC 80197 / JCM 7670 / NBRC 15755 / NCIMB 13165 / 161) TaxID=240015 RepID=C1FA37_ACIC5|nr:hypothetical protein ACP_0418 [Acidobacterium capsulatum ATCC 51196]